MQFKTLFQLLSVLVLAGTLAACEDSESRAERHYQSGLSLLEAGDMDRALVEFRNVFNLNGAHREARSTYARVVRERGNLSEAFSQYLRLVEQYPDDLEGRIALSEMAFISRQQDPFERHSAAAIELAPQDPRAQAIAAAAAYQTAAKDKDGPAMDAAFDKAVALIADQPDNKLLQQVEIAGNLRNEDYAKALDAIDRALASNPDSPELSGIRLRVLARLDDQDGIEAQLRHMVATFPDEDGRLKTQMMQFYLSRDEADKAEEFLRGIADPNGETPDLYMGLVSFVAQMRGPDAAIAELDQAISVADDPSLFQAVRAGYIFSQGQRTEAIAAMEAIIAASDPSDQQRRIKVSLADMLLKTNNEVGARQLVEQVLAEDPSQVAALRMTADWLIQADDTDGAIASLRKALDQAPQDVAAMEQMSQAYLRSGNRDLARDFLSLAVDTSNQAPALTLKYAQFLREEDRLIPAEQALVASLRQNRNNLALLTDLGKTYLLLDDRPRLRQVIGQLRALGTDDATKSAAGLQTALIEKESGSEEAIKYLEDISKDWDNALAAQFTVIRARLATGDKAGALASAENALAEDPTDPIRRYLVAATQAATGQLEAAEQGYRALLDETPTAPNIWLQLMRVINAQGRTEEAIATLQAGIDANPNAPDLLWARAGQLEKAGDVDGAIEVYEALYAENPDAVIISNNLASLLASHRDDAQSLERAAVVARRLRGMDQFAFRDTYGWIAFRQGNLEDALEYLEPAAAGLTADPQVQYHLGRLYQALDRTDEAKAQYQKALDLAGPDSVLPAMDDARDRLEALK